MVTRWRGPRVRLKTKGQSGAWVTLGHKEAVRFDEGHPYQRLGGVGEGDVLLKGHPGVSNQKDTEDE